MDLDRHLRFLSQNPTLKLEVISSSSQIIGGTSRPTLASGLLLEDEEDKDDEEDEDDDEDGEVRDGVLALWTGRVTYFLFLRVGGWTTELEDRRPVAGACLNVSFWPSFRRAWHASESTKQETS